MASMDSDRLLSVYTRNGAGVGQPHRLIARQPRRVATASFTDGAATILPLPLNADRKPAPARVPCRLRQ